MEFIINSSITSDYCGSDYCQCNDDCGCDNYNCGCDGEDCSCNDKSTDDCSCFEYVHHDDCRMGA